MLVRDIACRVPLSFQQGVKLVVLNIDDCLLAGVVLLH